MRHETYDSRRPLVFTHVPKTAGTSVWFALERALDTQGLHGYDGITFGEFDEWDT